MSTPEGNVKRAVSKLLSQHRCYYHMPVVSGYGRPSLDYIGCMRGKFFGIETKAPGKKPTDRQKNTIEQMRSAGAAVFVIDGTECADYKELEQFLNFYKHKGMP